MSNVKKPVAGEWWEIESGFRVRVIGRKLDGIFLCEEMGGKVNRFDIKNAHWKHLPDCDSFDWKPEVFPQYVVPKSGLFGGIGDGYCIRRTSPTDYEYVHANRIEPSSSKWGTTESFDMKSGSWKYVTREEAEALLTPLEVFPQYWTTLDRDSTLPESAAFVIRTNKINWNIVWKNGHEGICMGAVSKWSTSGRTQLTKEQAEALLLPATRTVVIIRWLCWNEVGKERIVQAANRPTGFLNCLNVGEEKFEVTL